MQKISKSMLYVLAIAASFLFLAGQVQSKEVRCEFDSWQGYNEEVAISWVGLGFEVDEENRRIRQVFDEGVTKWISADIIKTEKFVTFVYYITEEGTSKEQFRNRYGSRVYERGACEVNLSMDGYSPITARGKIKK